MATPMKTHSYARVTIPFSPRSLQSTSQMALFAPTASRAVGRVPKSARKYFEDAESAKLLTAEAKQAILNLCCPFPDTPLEPASWPALNATGSLPDIITSSSAITAPDGTTSSWNFKILIIPYIGSNWVKAGFTDNKHIASTTVSAPSGILDMYMLWKWKDGLPEPDPCSVLPDYVWSDFPEINRNMEQRVVANGVEVINTSPEISRGGMYYVSRFPMGKEHVSNFNATNTENFVPNQAIVSKLIVGVPNSVSDVMNLRSTVSGSAYNGAAFVNTPTVTANPLTVTQPTRLYWRNNYNGQTWLPNRPAPDAGVAPDILDSGWNAGSMYFVGLDPKATFTYKSRTYYEFAPGITDSKSYQSLARRGDPYSPLALEIIADIVTDMPAGFDYSENPLGEWFTKIMNKIARIAPIIGSKIGIPGGALIGHGVGALAGGIARLNGYQDPRQKGTPNKPPQTPMKPNHLRAKKSGQKAISSATQQK